MFEGYGVGLTIAPFGGPAVPGPREERPFRLAEIFPAGVRSDAATSHELVNVARLKDQLEAYQMHVVMDLAARRRVPEPGDPRPGRARTDGTADGPIPGTSEFFVDEVAMLLDCTQLAAGRIAVEAYLFLDRLPEVWVAVSDGALSMRRARVFADVLGGTAAGVAEAVAPRVLPEASRLSLRQLRARLDREVLAEDADAAERRRREAEKRAAVRLFPVGDGMSRLATDLPAPVAAACWSTIDELAWMRKNDGDERPIDQLRAITHAELILRPWDTSRPPVTAHLTVQAPLDSLRPDGEEPAEVDGQAITAAQVRELLADLDALCPGGLQAPTGGTLSLSITDARGALLATATRAELERIARQGCPAHPAADCGCTVLTRPPAVDRYRPTPAQRRFGKARDRTCRHPHCAQPVGRIDLDHARAYADGGPTDCDNLCCLCRHHHRLKTHAGGWRFVLLAHGVLRVTTPGGITRTTRPPGLRDRIEQRALPAPPPPPEEPPPF